MDVSPIYIKMCEKAEEIQSSRREEHNKDTGKWQAGDFWTTLFEVNKGNKFTFVVPAYRDAWADLPHYIHHPIECIWLPRQDQLQEMANKPIDELWCDFSAWVDIRAIRGMGDYRLREYKSFEQLWLAFVMWQKYNKMWNGETWEINERRKE